MNEHGGGAYEILFFGEDYTQWEFWGIDDTHYVVIPETVLNMLRETLEKLRRKHYECEDCFYSCPKSGESCNDTRNEIGKCDCGADEDNALIDAALAFK